MKYRCKDCAYYVGRERGKIVYWCRLKQQQVSPYQRVCDDFSESRISIPKPKHVPGIIGIRY